MAKSKRYNGEGSVRRDASRPGYWRADLRVGDRRITRRRKTKAAALKAVRDASARVQTALPDDPTVRQWSAHWLRPARDHGAD